MRIKAPVAAAAAALSMVAAGLAIPATAAEPVAQCPARWDLRESATVGRAILIGDRSDENGDGWLCYRDLNFPTRLPILLVQDNQFYSARI